MRPSSGVDSESRCELEERAGVWSVFGARLGWADLGVGIRLFGYGITPDVEFAMNLKPVELRSVRSLERGPKGLDSKGPPFCSLIDWGLHALIALNGILSTLVTPGQVERMPTVCGNDQFEVMRLESVSIAAREVNGLQKRRCRRPDNPAMVKSLRLLVVDGESPLPLVADNLANLLDPAPSFGVLQ